MKNELVLAQEKLNIINKLTNSLPMELKTANYYIRFNDVDKSIFMRDLTDVYNETAAYNKAKRGYKAFKSAIVSAIQSGDLSTFNT